LAARRRGRAAKRQAPSLPVSRRRSIAGSATKAGGDDKSLIRKDK
jgi:hypothetical protein